MLRLNVLAVLGVILKLFAVKHNMQSSIGGAVIPNERRPNTARNRLTTFKHIPALARNALGKFSGKVLNWAEGEKRQLAIIDCR